MKHIVDATVGVAFLIPHCNGIFSKQLIVPVPVYEGKKNSNAAAKSCPH
jgi:hypothetical protein